MGSFPALYHASEWFITGSVLYTKTTSGPRHSSRSQVCSDMQPDAPKQTVLQKYFYPVTRMWTLSSIFLCVITFEPWKTAHSLSFWKQRKALRLPVQAEHRKQFLQLACTSQKSEIKLIPEEKRLKGNSSDTNSKLKFHSLQNSKQAEQPFKTLLKPIMFTRASA